MSRSGARHTDAPAKGGLRQRTCIACGAQSGKADLLRIVRAADGSVFFDPTGRAAGRGAYVCSPACFVAARKAHRIERALKTKASQDDLDRVAEQLGAVAPAQG